MKIAFLSHKTRETSFRECGSILEGMKDLGHEVSFISLNIPLDTDSLKHSFQITSRPYDKVIRKTLEDVRFWEKLDVDLVISFTKLNPLCTKIVKAIKKANKFLIIKADTDGTLGFPLVRRYMKVISFTKNPLKYILRQIKWRFPIKYFIQQQIKLIELADAVIIESPEALSNVAFILYYWQYQNLIEKLCFVPNPVNDRMIYSSINKKENIIICVGRYDQKDIKNTDVMVDSLIEFLKIKKEFRAIIIGTGERDIKLRLSHCSPEVRSKIEVMNYKPHEELHKFLSSSKIFFHPSRLESFGIAAAEAVCMGNSIVGGPLEPLRYLSSNGFSGTIASDFKTKHMVSALLEESLKWDRDVSKDEKISKFWRKRLEKKKIAEEILKIVYILKNKKL